ncbi:MAG TPA: LutB/LldF family L-lactate oxidation iron-sulfur protein [Burkholderiales bacterium]|jgi:L-lactate dehydrogenase complex protein LldF|nr:LutB/LldF family L-lactate oxidation iron-sulfur protein [Burkholderiales bacterium]
MQVASIHFKSRAGAKLADANLQSALAKLQANFVGGRARRVAELDNFEAIRDAAAAIRDRALADLDLYLEEFERNAAARGAVVHWAETTEEVNRIVLDIARRHGVKKAVKSKSMVTEECALNDALEAGGIEVVETDLGEYILQLAKEPPSHIVAPVVHKTREEVSDLFEDRHRLPRKTDIADLTREARGILRPHFLSADMGISGANFVVAETGSTLIVTNEGNGRLVTTLPRVHVAITGIEKVVPSLEDVATLMRLLPPHGTGQTISNYISVTTGVRAPGECEGPEHFHVILVDGGRTKLIGGDMQPMLRCIRCGACMNHCPVYQSVGGHAYGWVYPGPMGSILTPTYVGLENAPDLPNASTFCNQCGVVCPVKIPLPDLMRKLRERQFGEGMKPWPERLGLAVWQWAARRPVIYAMITDLAARVLARMGGADRLIRALPFGGGWTDGRDLPAAEGRTFRELYAKGERRNERGERSQS